jgi:hypothetical protein
LVQRGSVIRGRLTLSAFRQRHVAPSRRDRFGCRVCEHSDQPHS